MTILFSLRGSKNICKKVIEKLEAKSIKDMGKVMGILKTKHGDILDFSVVNRILKTLLNK